MTKRRVLLAVLVVFVCVSILNAKHTRVYAPELFGIADAYSLKAGRLSAGVMFGWGNWILMEYSTSKDASVCFVIPITKTLYDSRPVYCQKFYNGERFTGFIYFRGHERPFCSGDRPRRPCLKLESISHGE